MVLSLAVIMKDIAAVEEECQGRDRNGSDAESETVRSRRRRWLRVMRNLELPT